MTEIERLRKAIHDLHGCESTHLRSEPVQETFEGNIVWDGVVEVFRLKNHPRALLGYVWSHETDEGGRRCVAVLGVLPINCARDAVRASIVAAQGSRS